MSAQSPKLVGIGFGKASKNPLLQQFEEVYVYGVLSQLARFTDIQYKDQATTGERLSFDAKLSYDDALKRLQQICNSTRTQYLFTGVLNTPVGGGSDLTEVKVTFRLYEAAGNRYIVDEVTSIAADRNVPSDGQTLNFPVAEMNRLINQTVTYFARAIFGENPGNQPSNAPLSQSLNAMQLILRAHQTSGAPEKIRLYEEAIKEDPQLETAYYHLARIYKAENEYEKAIFYYRETLKVSYSSRRNKSIYATDAGIACALMGKMDFALQWWTKAIEYDASYILPYFNIANTYEDLDKYNEAEQYFLKAQQLAPDDFRTFFNLARIYSKMGAWDKALTQYRFQLQTEDGDPWCHSDVATCYLNLGDVEHARQHLEKTVALDPDGEAGQYAQLILSGLG